MVPGPLGAQMPSKSAKECPQEPPKRLPGAYQKLPTSFPGAPQKVPTSFPKASREFPRAFQELPEEDFPRTFRDLPGAPREASIQRVLFHSLCVLIEFSGKVFFGTAAVFFGSAFETNPRRARRENSQAHISTHFLKGRTGWSDRGEHVRPADGCWRRGDGRRQGFL